MRSTMQRAGVMLLTVGAALVVPACTSTPPPASSTSNNTTIALLGACYDPTQSQSTVIRIYQFVGSGSSGSIQQWGQTYHSTATGGQHIVPVPASGQFSFTVDVVMQNASASCCNPATVGSTAVFNYNSQIGNYQSSYGVTLKLDYCQ